MNTTQEEEQCEITPSTEYIKGFNEGYIMAKFNPNFSKDSISTTNTSDRSRGFSKGMMQFDVERKMERTLSRFSKEDINRDFTDKNRDKDRELDRE